MKQRIKHLTPLDSMQNELIGITRRYVGEEVKEILHSAVVMNQHEGKGTVVYVHPCGRFYTVEFKFGDAVLRESYLVRSDVNPIKFRR